LLNVSGGFDFPIPVYGSGNSGEITTGGACSIIFFVRLLLIYIYIILGIKFQARKQRTLIPKPDKPEPKMILTGAATAPLQKIW